MDNMEEMDKFQEKYNLPKLNQEEIKITADLSQAWKLKLEYKIFQQTKAQDQMASQLNSTKNLKSKHLSYSNSFRKLQRKVNFQTHSIRPTSP